ncbi:hypothetical protein N7463_002060 [Penicillium fimorum]|uniref:Uncharacterized protein n=1 Tax=Penicillium fimorum TaxID=1882269 RepID=A0A9X0C7Z4_9EURO|nr:hypothetical protein N7463_002060 [Penicillium fimorum]
MYMQANAFIGGTMLAITCRGPRVCAGTKQGGRTGVSMPRCSLSEKVTSRHSLVESDNTLPVSANNHLVWLEKMQQRHDHWAHFFAIHHERFSGISYAKS